MGQKQTWEHNIQFNSKFSKTIIMMKFSTLAIAVFASTALFSVTSAAGSGGVRGSIDDQTQAHRSLDGVCSDCAGCLMSSKALWLTEKCQTKNFFNTEVDMTEENCDSLINMKLADRWCAAGIDDFAEALESADVIDEDIDYGDSEAQNVFNTNGAALNGGQDANEIKRKGGLPHSKRF